MTRPLLLLVPILLVSACASRPSPGSEAAVTAPTQTYVCESGDVIAAAYPDTESATVNYQGHTLQMKIAISASGARYVGERLEWWTRGSGPGAEGTLLRHNADGTSGDVLERCVGK